ncbi:MAG TPA: squalene synthase HpnC [Rhodospirillaceae bacterium]|nr:squalene synthase HpnC [Candidatus Neomarinimicrobiota bacterium]HCX15155.1 squalene synthase HpnC [Rhodospirillaceae bacterium]
MLRKIEAPVETPSGKGARDENFPVGSWLIQKKLRPHVAAFYAFARAIDDIADNPELRSGIKISRLNGFADALCGNNEDPSYAKAHVLRTKLNEVRVTTQYGLDLISAFKQDAIKSRYTNWSELIDYCNRSAAPVGRFLLDLHGERASLYKLSDDLCNALQIINHLQDCAIDYANLNRVYLPEEWMQTQSSNVVDLAQTKATPALRAVIDRCLDGTDKLLAQARKLPVEMEHKRLAMETAVIVAIAERLSKKLRHCDPLSGSVVLKWPGFALASISGLLRLWFRA